jgi:antitoxin component YwqK of YwqJK toxin-antitoxin module
MKRVYFSFISVFILSHTNAQVHRYWIGDTAHIRCMYDTVFEAIPDTMVFLKPLTLVKRKDTVGIYWDKNMQHRQESYLTGNGTLNDTTFYRNGNIDNINYRNGLKDVDYYEMGWYLDGTKKLETTFSKKEKIETYYYNNGMIKQTDVYLKGLIPNDTAYYQWAYSKRWCENGTVIYQDSINSLRVRLITNYYCNGRKKTEFTVYHGRAVGKWCSWYPNGQIKQEGQYLDTTESNKIRNGIYNNFGDKRWGEQGMWKYYDETGKLIREAIYKDGEIIEEKKY